MLIPQQTSHCVLSPQRILIVEDQLPTQQILQELFSMEHPSYTLVSATDGQQALDLLESGPLPNLIILDLLLPGVSGYEVLEEVKQHPKWRMIPLLILTADKLVHKRLSTHLVLSLSLLVMEKPFHLGPFLLEVARLLSEQEA